MATDYTVQTHTYPNAIIRVHIPILTEQERNRRLEYVRQAAEALLKSKK